MQRKTLPLLFLAVFLLVLVCLCGIRLNARFPQLASGSTFSPAECANGAALTNWEQIAPGRWRFAISITPGTEQLAVCLVGNSRSSAPEGLAPLRRNSDFYLLPAASGTAELLISSQEQPCAWLIPVSQAQFWNELRTDLQLVSLVAFVTMGITILALFFFKPRPELGWFLLYVLLMCVWDIVVLLSPASSNALLRTVRRAFFSLAVIVPALLCGALTHTGSTPLGTPKAQRQLAFCGVFFVLSMAPIQPFRIPLLYLGMLGILILLLYALAHGSFSALYLLYPYSITYGLRVLTLLPSLSPSFYTESLPFYILRCARIYDLPFALGCLIYVCRRFALQFDRTEQLAQELDTRVTQRTQALQAEADARKSMMMNIFHDLRSPLFVVSSGLNTLAASPDSLPTLLPILQQRVDFVRDLTEELFLAAKLEQKQILLNEDRAQLDEITAEVCRGCQAEAQHKGVTLSADISVSLPVWGDQLRLQQILQNLVTNAIHYTPPGGTIAVVCTRSEDAAHVSVSDTGCGIAPEDQPAVFQRYFRTDPRTKHDSTGLGLTIAQELAHLHHGEITLTSEPGKGSCFVLHLPLLPE